MPTNRDHRVSTYLSEREVVALRNFAEHYGLGKSQAVRMLVSTGLKLSSAAFDVPHVLPDAFEQLSGRIEQEGYAAVQSDTAEDLIDLGFDPADWDIYEEPIGPLDTSD